MISTRVAPRIRFLIISYLFIDYFSQSLHLFGQAGELLDHLLLIRFQVGILSTELDILIQYLPVLTTEHIDGRLKLG